MRNSMNDLWMLSICVSVITYIMMATFLLTFDLEITKFAKGGVLAVYFGLSLILVYNYIQALKTFKVYERILEGGLTSGSFSKFRCKELNSLRALLDKARNRRFSYPIPSIEYRFFQHNWEHFALNEESRFYLYQLKPKTKLAAFNKTIETSYKGFHEIPANLHKCVKDLDSVIQHVKSLNLKYARNIDDTSALNQISETLTNNRNLEKQIAEEEEDIRHTLESTKYANEITSAIKSHSIKAETPVKKLNGVIQHVESLNLDCIRNLEDASVLNQNSETLVKQGNLENQILEEKGDIQHKLESIKCVKKTSCIIKSSSMKTGTPVKDLGNAIQHVKSLNFDYTGNLKDTSALNQNLETVTKNRNQENQTAEEEEVTQHKLESIKCAKEISCTVKSPSINTSTPMKDLEGISVLNQSSERMAKENLKNQTAEEEEYIQHKLESTKYANEFASAMKSTIRKTWTQLNGLDSVIQHVKSVNFDYTRNLEDTLVLNQNTKTVTRKENQIAEEEEIQHKLESPECTKETSYTIKSSSMKTCTPVEDLVSVIQHVKSPNLNYTRNMEDTLVLNQNSETMTKEGNLENQIAEEDIQHKVESTECAEENSCIIKNLSMKTSTPVKNVDSVIKQVKSINLDFTRNLATSVVNKNSEIVTKKENLENQIAEEKGEIHHKLESTKCAKKISCIVKSTSILPQTTHQDSGTKEKLTRIVIFQANISAHCLWTSLLHYKGTYDGSLSIAKKFIRKVISVTLNAYASFLMKIPLNKQEFKRINSMSNLYAEKLVLIFYKTRAHIRQNPTAPVSFNKHVPNISLRPYELKVSFTPCMREMSRKRYINEISQSESEIRKKNSTIIKDTHRISKFFPSLLTKGHGISVDDMLLSFQRSLPAVMDDPSITANEILIPKFEEADLKHFFAISTHLEECYWLDSNDN